MEDIAINISRGTVADVEAVAQFQLDMAMESEGLVLDRETVLKGVAAVVEDPSKGEYYVARINGNAVGSLMLTKEWSDWNNRFYWWIQSVFVRPEYRGQGVFTCMYNKLMGEAHRQHVTQVRLYVDRSNARAQQCYTRLGMHESHYLMYETETKL